MLCGPIFNTSMLCGPIFNTTSHKYHRFSKWELTFHKVDFLAEKKRKGKEIYKHHQVKLDPPTFDS